jgi:hypothetical protein
MTKKIKQKHKVAPKLDECQLDISRLSKGQGTRLDLPVGEPDLEALDSVTREWLVPCLVERFLRQQKR